MLRIVDLKKNAVVKWAYSKTVKVITVVLMHFSPVLATKFYHRRATGQALNLKNPQDFNEKLQWLKLYWRHPVKVQCADKYEVRSYLRDRGCEEALNELYGVYDDVSEINWDSLPQQFVLKTTNGCGSNIICSDKRQLNKAETVTKLKRWLKTNFSLVAGETHYSEMTPRIICEKYLKTPSGLLPIDYKVFCFNGEPRVILVITSRETGHHQRFFFDLNWNPMELTKIRVLDQELPARPRSLEQMLDYAGKLAKGIPFVRIDFYDVDGKAVFGEMTFTPVGCAAPYYNENASKMLGDWIQLPEK